MRRLVSIVLVALVVALAATPAVAQQDPFEPRGPGGGTAGGETPQPPETGADETGTPEAQEPPATPQTENLPDTGADPKPWIVLAYGLIFIGAALVTISRALRVSPVAVPSSPRALPDEALSGGSSR